ncbi:hypothetical protein HID58_018489, partial [Brassica napus]
LANSVLCFCSVYILVGPFCFTSPSSFVIHGEILLDFVSPNSNHLLVMIHLVSFLAVPLGWDPSPTTSTIKQSLQVPLTSNKLENDKGDYKRRDTNAL